MNLLMQTATDTATGLSFPWAFTAVYVVGFIAAVGIGSIAWYNSKRPAGWESKKRPDFVPEVEKEENKSVGEN
ncbi:MAG: photosystem II assembly protein Psb35 [Rivularia sp. (in: cyanobacteria)]